MNSIALFESMISQKYNLVQRQ